MNDNGICLYNSSIYEKISTDPTLISLGGFAKPKKYNAFKYLQVFIIVALLSGIVTYWYLLNQHQSPVACIETVYMLRSGQSATCNDSRSRINIVSASINDVAFMCKCIEDK